MREITVSDPADQHLGRWRVEVPYRDVLVASAEQFDALPLVVYSCMFVAFLIGGEGVRVAVGRDPWRRVLCLEVLVEEHRA